MVKINIDESMADKVFGITVEQALSIRDFIYSTATKLNADSPGVYFATGQLINAVANEYLQVGEQFYQYAIFEIGYLFGFSNAVAGKQWNKQF